jgi:hypothetical protein
MGPQANRPRPPVANRVGLSRGGEPSRTRARGPLPMGHVLMTSAQIRRLSNEVFAIAQAARQGAITEHGWERLLDAGLALRELAGLPPPWHDSPEQVKG